MRVRIITALQLLSLVFWGCSGEFVTSQESDLAKYPEIHVFVHQMLRFQGDVTDLENGTFRFSYSSHEADPQAILHAIDMNATADGWQMVFQKGMKRGYMKNLHRYPAQTQADIVIVAYDDEDEAVYVEWQSN